MRVDLHCHSTWSDGAASPSELAEALASAGVQVASLTDHDTTEGRAEFATTLSRLGVACVAGVEISTRFEGAEVHLLGYGFDPDHEELSKALRSLRAARPTQTRSVAGSMRRSASAGPVNGGVLATPEAIALLHRAGGRAFVAHPLHSAGSIEELEALLVRLRDAGLDGIEAIYGPFSEVQREELCDLADRLGLLVSAGTDIHAVRGRQSATIGIDMPDERWRAFRDAVCLQGVRPAAPGPAAKRHRGRPHWRAFAVRVAFPSFLALALFFVAIYAIFLPTFERSLMDRKREMIRELTNSAWSILAGFERDVRTGVLPEEQAKRLAISRIESLRYGREGKDYFWLQDLRPVMIMHPYRRDLNGTDVSHFEDPRGRRIFAEFANLARRSNEGYVEYVWQWKDDPTRLEPKESYIKAFEPWGWVIGTGLYVEDVHEETRQLEQSFLRIALGISAIVALLLLYVVRQSLGLERERADAEEDLFATKERYRALVEATTEGTLLVADGRCRFANPIFLDLAGSSMHDLELLDLHDLFPIDIENGEAWRRFERLLAGAEVDEGFDATLRRLDGGYVECVLSASRMEFESRTGFILMVRPVTSDREGSDGAQRWAELDSVADAAPWGLFRFKPAGRGAILEHTAPVRRLLGPLARASESGLVLADAFGEPGKYEAFLARLHREGTATECLAMRSRTIKIAAHLESPEPGSMRTGYGFVRDITDETLREDARSAEIQRYERALDFLHRPVIEAPVAFAPVVAGTPIAVVARAMVECGASIAVVRDDHGRASGVVTDEDLRVRWAAEGLSPEESVQRIMSAPVVGIPASATVWEALLAMDARKVHHVVVTGADGVVVGAVRSADLAPFHDFGPIALLREVRAAAERGGVVRAARGAPELARRMIGPAQTGRFLAAVVDAATARFAELAEARLGPAPAPYALLALGSHGRREMTLSSDQDNALLIDGATSSDTGAYFAELAEAVCAGLEACGFVPCPGGVMARNPAWRLGLDSWMRTFSGWMSLPEPQPLLEFAIFFDFRAVHGDADLAHRLRRHVLAESTVKPSFLPHLAHSTLQFRPPARVLGRYVSGADGAGRIDLKEAMITIVGFARLYALREGLHETNTLDRLKALADAGAIKPATAHAASTAFETLWRLRFAAPSGPAVFVRDLNAEDQERLAEAFAEIAVLQKKVQTDFLGGASL